MIRTLSFLALATSAIAAPALAQPARAPSDRTYSALGTEPFWGLELNGQRMIFSYDEQRVSVAQPRVVRMGTTRRYMTSRMVVLITPGACSDGMSERTYAENVRVTLSRGINTITRFEGCGGGLVPPSTLANTAWRIVAINGAPVRQAPSQTEGGYQLSFEQDRITGNAGCNRLSGPYSEARRRLTVGPIISTRMACPGVRMQHERAVMAVLNGNPRIVHPASPAPMRDGVTITLTSSAGSIQLRQID